LELNLKKQQLATSLVNYVMFMIISERCEYCLGYLGIKPTGSSHVYTQSQIQTQFPKHTAEGLKIQQNVLSQTVTVHLKKL
jgi:hypothetical protein